MAAENNGPERDAKGRLKKGNKQGFPPGQSGNPGGRPRGEAAARERFRDLSSRGLDALAEAIDKKPWEMTIDGEAIMASADLRLYLELVKFVTEYAWARPKQSVDVEVKQSGPPILKAMSLDDRRALKALLDKGRASGSTVE